MCEYCEEPTKSIKWNRQETDTNISECYIHKAADGYAMFLRQGLKVDIGEDLKMKISQTHKCAYLNIKYCLMCGRKLEK